MLFSAWVFISQYKHLLVILIRLEIISLSVLWIISVWGGGGAGEEFFILLFLGIVACEGRIGLAVLVRLVRSHGRDKFEGLSLLRC